jgi:hypothetical protein
MQRMFHGGISKEEALDAIARHHFSSDSAKRIMRAFLGAFNNLAALDASGLEEFAFVLDEEINRARRTK